MFGAPGMPETFSLYYFLCILCIVLVPFGESGGKIEVREDQGQVYAENRLEYMTHSSTPQGPQQALTKFPLLNSQPRTSLRPLSDG